MSLNVSTLGVAKEEYMDQLKIHLGPLIYEGFVSLYEDAKKKEDETLEYEGNYLKQFQKTLCDIPYWNQSIIDELTKNMLNELEYMMELVAAVFVSRIRILTCVMSGKKSTEMKFKIPTTDVFIHMVYCKTAKIFYYNPYKFLNVNNRENYDGIMDMIDKSINDTINSMIPIESILKEYLSNVFSGHIKDNSKAKTVERIPDNDFTSGNNLTNGNDFTNNNTSPFNDSFGAGGEFSNEEFPSENIEAGNEEQFSFGNTNDANNIAFRDDETIFTAPPSKEESMFDRPEQSESKSNDDPFANSGSGNNDDPFANSGSGNNDDPFANSGSGNNDDPFANSGSGDSSDMFKDEDIFNNSAPTPSILNDNKEDEINFFGDLP